MAHKWKTNGFGVAGYCGGIFPDMGVGRGQAFGDGAANKLAGGCRKKENWTREIATQELGKSMGGR